MLNNATGFKKIYLALGYTDLRRGIEGLKSIIHFRYDLDPYDKDTLFLFCGRRSDRIKGLSIVRLPKGVLSFGFYVYRKTKRAYSKMGSDETVAVRWQ